MFNKLSFIPKDISTKFDGEVMLIRLVTDTCVNFIQLENMTGWESNFYAKIRD